MPAPNNDRLEHPVELPEHVRREVPRSTTEAGAVGGVEVGVERHGGGAGVEQTEVGPIAHRGGTVMAKLDDPILLAVADRISGHGAADELPVCTRADLVVGAAGRHHLTGSGRDAQGSAAGRRTRDDWRWSARVIARCVFSTQGFGSNPGSKCASRRRAGGLGSRRGADGAIPLTRAVVASRGCLAAGSRHRRREPHGRPREVRRWA